jgi:hypothetical protein
MAFHGIVISENEIFVAGDFGWMIYANVNTQQNNLKRHAVASCPASARQQHCEQFWLKFVSKKLQCAQCSPSLSMADGFSQYRLINPAKTLITGGGCSSAKSFSIVRGQFWCCQ